MCIENVRENDRERDRHREREPRVTERSVCVLCVTGCVRIAVNVQGQHTERNETMIAHRICNDVAGSSIAAYITSTARAPG